MKIIKNYPDFKNKTFSHLNEKVTQTIGLNNPGNIRYNPDFQGCVGQNKGFCNFSSLGFGYRALLVILTSYYTKYGIKTIRGIISRYAPPTENLTEKYITEVSKMSGFSSDEILKEDNLINLIPPIAKMENSISITVDEVKNLIGSVTGNFGGGFMSDIGSEIQDEQTKKITTGKFGDQTVEVYSTSGDPYEYCVVDGVWYSKGGPDNKKGTWEYFEDWTSLEKNCEANSTLDKIHTTARKTSEIELNRQKFCSFPQDVEKHKKEWVDDVSGKTI